ncbi:MAG: hypothetical protein ACJ779_10590 [Chloroflexota bacterium]
MLRGFRNRRDPFWDDGVGARQRHDRVRVESLIAFSLSVVACGLTAAVWLQPIVQSGARLVFH